MNTRSWFSRHDTYLIGDRVVHVSQSGWLEADPLKRLFSPGPWLL